VAISAPIPDTSVTMKPPDVRLLEVINQVQVGKRTTVFEDAIVTIGRSEDGADDLRLYRCELKVNELSAFVN
jgi:hypothetical protein